MDSFVEDFCQNPLTRLKEFKRPKSYFISDEFLLRLEEAFPVIETINIERVRFDYDYSLVDGWDICNFIGVLQTLVTVKNFSFRGVEIVFSKNEWDLTADYEAAK